MKKDLQLLLNEEVSEGEEHINLDEELGKKKKRGRPPKQKTKEIAKLTKKEPTNNKSKKKGKGDDDRVVARKKNGDNGKSVGDEKRNKGVANKETKTKTRKRKTTTKPTTNGDEEDHTNAKEKETNDNTDQNENNANETIDSTEEGQQQQQLDTSKKKRKKPTRRSENDGDEVVVEEEKDISKMPLKDIIKFNAQKGKPTKAAVERQESRKKKKVNGSENGDEGNEPDLTTTNTPPAIPLPSSLLFNPPSVSVPTLVHNLHVPPSNSNSTAHHTPTNNSHQPMRLDSLASPAPVTNIAPQIRTDENGNFVLDEESMIYTSEAPRADSEMAEENPFTTSSSFSSRAPAEKWTVSETTQFYSALRRYGTDFTLIEKLFATRTRKQLKNKFKREEREHPFKIETALTNRIAINFEEYQKDITNAAEKRKQIQEKAQIQAQNQLASNPPISANTPTQNTTTTTTSTNTPINTTQHPSIPRSSTLGSHSNTTKIVNTPVTQTTSSSNIENTVIEEDHSLLVFNDPVYTDTNDYDVAQYDEDYE